MDDDPSGEAAFEEPCAAVALRVVAAAAWHVVLGRRFSDFPLVLTFVEKVAEAVPEMVPFQHLIKLRLGLQAKIVMNMLQEDEPQGKIYEAIDTYFPENEAPLDHFKPTAQDLEKVQKAQENFRILVLRLLSDSMEKEIYVQEFLETDYGEAFVKEVEKLFCHYICHLEYILPDPQFHMVLEAASFQTPSQSCATILYQYFSAVGYWWADSPPHSACDPCQSEDEDPHTSPLSPQPDCSRSVDSSSCISEWDSYRWSSETTEDLVPESESEISTSPFQVE